ncbi:MAG: lactate racemase domain-containing protein [Bryobacteraceae bacterium]|jgi:nickel-dependent lactate racemase
MSNTSWNRRQFMDRAGLASAQLIGTALLPGKGIAQSVAASKGSPKSVVIPTHEWAGDIDERLDFPSAWEINVLKMRGHDAPVITPEEIHKRLLAPIGTPPLRELAAGKKKVVVTFDDLTRGTPTYLVMPCVVDELKAAGVADEGILFIGSFGSHRPMTAIEVQKKIGKDIARRFAWMNHNVVSNFDEVGTTSFKDRILVNSTFMAADLRVTVSGIRVHNDAGYGGGAKAVLPGVCALDTNAYAHTVIAVPGNKTCGQVKIFKNEMRLNMIEAARLAKVNFSVQVIYNSKLKPTHLFSGDVVEAHHAACRVAVHHYCTPTFQNADVVVVNAYPLTAQAGLSQQWIGRSLRDGGTGVMILQHPLTLDPIHYVNQMTRGRKIHDYFTEMQTRQQRRLPDGTGLIVYSQYLDRQMMNTYPTETQFAATWADVIRLLQQRHHGDMRVAVYPYGGIQHQEVELDG